MLILPQKGVLKMHANLWKRAKADYEYFREIFRVLFYFIWHHKTPGEAEKKRLAQKYQIMDGKGH